MVCLPARPLLVGTTLSYRSYNGTIYGGRTRQDERHRLARVLYSLKERDRLSDDSGDECGYHTVCQDKKSSSRAGEGEKASTFLLCLRQPKLDF